VKRRRGTGGEREGSLRRIPVGKEKRRSKQFRPEGFRKERIMEGSIGGGAGVPGGLGSAITSVGGCLKEKGGVGLRGKRV